MSEAIQPTVESCASGTIYGFRTRVRVNHTKTQRGGHSYESTVEAEWAGDGGNDEAALERHMSLLRKVGDMARAEAAHRALADAIGTGEENGE